MIDQWTSRDTAAEWSNHKARETQPTFYHAEAGTSVGLRGHLRTVSLQPHILPNAKPKLPVPKQSGEAVQIGHPHAVYAMATQTSSTPL